ncbi:MAG: hypothetical protein RL398_1307, partial [Planctomycetota bacterium]
MSPFLRNAALAIALAGSFLACRRDDADTES